MSSSTAARITDWLIMAIVVGLLGLAAWQFMGPSENEALIGEPAPAFNLKTLDGQVTGTSQHPGKVVLLDFWATWCPPCIKQMPALRALDEDPGLDGVLTILSINTDDDTPERDQLVGRFVESRGLRFPVLYDTGHVSKLYGVRRIPTLVLIAPSGEVTYSSTGVHSADDLRDRILAAHGGR